MSFFLKDGRCHGRLSITKSAIAGAHLTMLEDLESLFFQSGAKQTGKATIVHASTRKRDLSNSG